MKKKTRRIIFYIFLFFFIVLVPLIIFYSLGYSFDFENKEVVRTGAIYLKSYPKKAEIYIDGKLKGKTDKFIKRLIPKEYEIKITKEDYYSWEKNLIVKEGLVVKANNILLVPFNPKIFLITTESEEYNSFFEQPYDAEEILEIVKRKSRYSIFNIENINLNSKQDKIYFLSNNNLYSLELDEENLENSILSEILISNVVNFTMYKNGIIYSDYFTGKIFELDLSNLESAEFFEQVFPDFGNGEWILSTDGKKLLCKKQNSVEILWLDDVTEDSITREKGEIEKIKFNEKITNVIWHPKTDEHLIVSTEDSILITEIDNREPRNTIDFITTNQPQIKYDYKNETLYFLSEERLYKTEL